MWATIDTGGKVAILGDATIIAPYNLPPPYIGLSVPGVSLYKEQSSIPHEICHQRQMSNLGYPMGMAYVLNPDMYEDYMPNSPEKLWCPQWGTKWPLVVIYSK